MPYNTPMTDKEPAETKHSIRISDQLWHRVKVDAAKRGITIKRWFELMVAERAPDLDG